ncbi:hypothetical protein D1007_43636 [Hordeum vulgare]|nr:hypothetical protein D1007_43636 [Hordeum vulgare]
MFEDPAETADADDEEEEIPAEAPPRKKKKLMAEARPKKSSPKPSAPKKPSEFENNIAVMDDTHPSSATAREAIEATSAEASRNAPAPPHKLKTRDEQMSFLVSAIQGMEKNISEILLNHKSLDRIVETKFHDLDVKVTELSTTV